jgi:hypothetical protein
VVEVKKIAPLGDPIDVKMRGYHLSLRKEEAKDMEIELIQVQKRKSKKILPKILGKPKKVY